MPWSGTSYADGRQFAVHETESKRGDLRNSAFRVKSDKAVRPTEEGSVGGRKKEWKNRRAQKKLPHM